MEAPSILSLEQGGTGVEEAEKDTGGDAGRGDAGASPSAEDTDEDSEPEPARRRKVSFADMFGLDLVSVKEFDNGEAAEGAGPAPEDAVLPPDEFSMSCLFAVPVSAEELELRLRGQMIELENVELLPGTATLRGTIRVVNLCYGKSVYVRISPDRWESFTELVADYVPGSSDRRTDRFTFSYALPPPSEPEGGRVEFCLRYETAAGTFWANNKDMNYVLFCHRRGLGRDAGQDESDGLGSKRSCLKAFSRRGGAADEADESDLTTLYSTEAEELLGGTGKTRWPSLRDTHTHTAQRESSPRRSGGLPHVEGYVLHRRRQGPKAGSAESRSGLAHTQRPAIHHHRPHRGSATCLLQTKKSPCSHGQQVLTYHQIPLLTLDWSDKGPPWQTQCGDAWTDGEKAALSGTTEGNVDDLPSVSDIWEAFLNGSGHPAEEGSSACGIWQAFLGGTDGKDHSGVPESEWLQTAASVLPANDKRLTAQNTASDGERLAHAGTDTAAHLRLLAADMWQPLSLSAPNSDEKPPVQATRMDDSAQTLDTSSTSQTDSVTHTLRGFGLQGAADVSEAAADSSTLRKNAGEHGEEGAAAPAAGDGGGEALSPHIAHVLTSSGETETTDVTATPASRNASAVDSISLGARQDGRPLAEPERRAAGIAHNVMDDTLAFRETIRQGTKDGERFVSAGEGGFTENFKEKKVNTDREEVRPDGAGLSQPQEGECRQTGATSDSIHPNEAGQASLVSWPEKDITEPNRAKSVLRGDGSMQAGGGAEEYETQRCKMAAGTRSRNQHVGVAVSTEDVTPKQKWTKENAVGIPQRKEEERKEEDEEEGGRNSLQGDERADAWWLEMDAGEGMKGNTKEDLQRPLKDATAELKGGEPSAGPEGSLSAEGERATGGRKEGNRLALQLMEAQRPDGVCPHKSEQEAAEKPVEGKTQRKDVDVMGEASGSTGGKDPLGRHADPKPTLALGQDACLEDRADSRLPEMPCEDPSASSVFPAQWGALQLLGHVARALLYSMLVAGFLVVALLSDFPACFALYVVSLCWWCYAWRKHPVEEEKEREG